MVIDKETAAIEILTRNNLKLGADKVILPEEAGANQMASAAKEYL